MTSTTISRAEARRRLGVKPREFANLVRAGVFRRTRKGFDLASLEVNHHRAREIEAMGDAQIAAVRRDVARRLAELGAPSSHERTTP